MRFYEDLCVSEMICNSWSHDHSTRKSIDFTTLFLFHLFSKKYSLNSFNYEKKCVKNIKQCADQNSLDWPTGKFKEVHKNNKDEFLSWEMKKKLNFRKVEKKVKLSLENVLQ